MKKETTHNAISATGVRVSVPSLTPCSRFILRAYKYRIYPNAEQRGLLAKHFGCCRFIYNHFLQLRNETYKAEKKSLSVFDTHREMAMMRKEEDTKWLAEVYSHALQASLKHLDSAFKIFYKAIKAGKAEPIIRDGKPTGRRKYEPQFKSKHDRVQSITFPDNVKVGDGALILPKFKTPIKMEMHREISGGIRHAVVSLSATGKYHVSILCQETAEDLPKIEKTIGIDLGIKDLTVCSDGERVANPKFLERGEKHTKYLQRQKDKKKKGGRNRRRVQQRLARHHEKVANRRKDFTHKFTTRIVRDNQAVCVEDLNVKGMESNHHLAKSISSVAFGEIARQLEYKCAWYGRDFVKVGRYYPSSKTCNHCGHVNRGLTLKDREWVCDGCGREIDRDYNAALNIRDEGLRLLATGKQDLSGCGEHSDVKQKSGEAAA